MKKLFIIFVLGLILCNIVWANSNNTNISNDTNTSSVNGSSNESSASAGTTRAPIPFGAILLSLIAVPFIAYKKIK
ncbi:hypothetical protein [Methanocaldococcus bathoardescens]|uniref:hypothetical protein n=1 Tax=Methanocaldococcus bathoardescens TaxID=1301915 RepID=UPI00064FB911|nr:hypothetical protein [Methanocaldococcus bathoardescens]